MFFFTTENAFYAHFWVHLCCDPDSPFLPSALPSCSHLDLISVAVHICEQGKEGGREGLHGHFIMHLSSRKPAPPLVFGIDLKPLPK